MPLYDFQCKTCGHQFDTIAKMNDPPPPCPRVTESDLFDDDALTLKQVGDEIVEQRCGNETKKLISLGTFHLKGGGWEADGYG